MVLGRFGACGRFVHKEVCARTRDGHGGDRAHGCRKLASASVRHGSLLNLNCVVLACPAGRIRQDPHNVDGTSGIGVTRVVILNREIIATQSVTSSKPTVNRATRHAVGPSQVALSTGKKLRTSAASPNRVMPAPSDTLGNR